MTENRAIALAAKQTWLDGLADRLATAIRNAYDSRPAGRDVKNALNGVWLGHPLHPALTDVPVGAWTAAVAIDALDVASGRADCSPGASAAIAVGLAGAAGAAVTGLTDWSDTDGRSRRIGLVHGLLNVAATGLFVTSLVMRGQKKAGAGRLTALAGYALAGASAYLGGHLAFEEQIGVNHAANAEVPETFTPVIEEHELKEDTPTLVRMGDTRVVLVRHAGKVTAMADTCGHLGGPLSEGTLDGDAIVCPWHGSHLSLEDGHVVQGPTVRPQPYFETRVRDGQVEVKGA